MAFMHEEESWEDIVYRQELAGKAFGTVLFVAAVDKTRMKSHHALCRSVARKLYWTHSRTLVTTKVNEIIAAMPCASYNWLPSSFGESTVIIYDRQMCPEKTFQEPHSMCYSNSAHIFLDINEGPASICVLIAYLIWYWGQRPKKRSKTWTQLGVLRKLCSIA